ncbi:hypothetical protein [Burkholderia sp. Bp8998]|uniref:hypothetical protein n=1 Tax=Burkholderia sp. Bp8998 TaxID=2184557 RepID=UPI000F58F5A3|nr:hypothetical protein [Burkholderia sp. Bp8998]
MRNLLVLLLSFAVVACQPRDSEHSAEKVGSNATGENADAAAATRPAKAKVDQEAPPPGPGEVLHMIYLVEGDGTSSYPVQNGSIATYWAGHAFTLNGKRYFTGFAYNTSEKYNGNTKVDPSAGVTLTEATFELRDPGTAKPWAFVGNEYWIGEYGLMEKGPRFDGSRKVLEQRVDNGKILIAIPSVDGEAPNLIQTHYELFSYRPAPPVHTEDKRWNYLGKILVGEDYSATCKARPDLACTKWTGDVAFLPAKAGEMPGIRMVPHGTTVDDNTGESRPIGANDIQIYAFRNGSYGFK